MTGDDGGDSLDASLRASGDTPAIVSGSRVTMSGGKGEDILATSLSADGRESEGIATVGDNTLATSGDTGNDSVTGSFSAKASSESNAIISGNTLTMIGGRGEDDLDASLSASAEFAGTASLTDNVVRLEGGKGNDALSVALFVIVDEFSTATLSGNRITLNGGHGDDRLVVDTNGITGNSITLDGGKGTDTAVLNYGTSSDELVFDFSQGYSQTLADGTKLRGIQQVEVIGGSGDDQFTGGSGDDIFDGGEGIDTVVFEGSKDDYLVTELASGSVEVTDLRRHSPDGTDLIWNADAFVFAGQTFDLV